MKKQRKPPRPRNPEAQALESALFRSRVVPSGKVYRRKGRNPASPKVTEGE